MRDFDVVRKRIGINRKAVVLARDVHAAGLFVEHRMVGTVVTKLHLERLAAGSQAHDLVTKADAEKRNATLEAFAGRFNGVSAGLGIAGAVRQEHAVGIHGEHFLYGRASRHNGKFNAAVNHQAQNIALDTEVIGHNLVGRVLKLLKARRAVVGGKRPGAFLEFVRSLASDFACKISPYHRAPLSGGSCGRLNFIGRERPVCSHHDRAGLSTLGSQDASELAGVNVAKTDNACCTQII